MTRDRRNIFVVGLDRFNLRQLDTIRNREAYAFHDLLGLDAVVRAKRYPLPDLFDQGCRELDAFRSDGHSIDGIVGWWDFPTISLLPLLRVHVGLPTPSLESILRCEHKAWSRRLQDELFPDRTPDWTIVDPMKEGQTLADIDLAPPFWIKPVKSHSGWLGFRVATEDDLQHALRSARQDIWRLAEPFNWFLSWADLPDHIKPIDGQHMIAEQIIDGRQCTLESYVHKGETVTYGVVDSTREPNGHSFRAFQYPSRLPDGVQARLKTEARRWAERAGLDETPFNMEFYWDEARDKVWVLEINARMSKSHNPLFAMVDGASHQQVAVRLSHGADPDMPHREGRHTFASKFHIREYEDAYVTHVPTADEIAGIEREFPGVQINLEVKAGQWLHELSEQDSYSYAVGVIFVGADSPERAEDIFAAVRDRLPLVLVRRREDRGTVPRHGHG